MKKTIDTSFMTNELKGASLYFQPTPASAPLPVPATRPPVQQADRPTVVPSKTLPSLNSPERVNARTPSTPRTDPSERTPRTPQKRRVRRWAYDLYEDQVDAVRMLAGKAMLKGEKGSASALVREALDDFMTRKTGEE